MDDGDWDDEVDEMKIRLMTKLTWISIFPLLLLAGCQTIQPVSAAPDPKSPACMCDPDALSKAVLDRIFESGVGQQLYYDSERKITLEGLASDHKLINSVWTFSKKQTDRCLKDTYAHWAAYYQGEYEDHMNQLKHPNAVKEDGWQAEQKKRDREVEECKRRGIVPPVETGLSR